MLPRLKAGCATVKPGVLVRMNLPPTERVPLEILKCSILALRAPGTESCARAWKGVHRHRGGGSCAELLAW